MDTLETPLAESPAPEPTLAEHEAEYAPASRRTNQPDPGPQEGSKAPTPSDRGPGQAERDAVTGKFQPRQRAASQKAGPDDVARISALTKEYHDAVTEAGLDIKQEEGESNRVYELRRRVEVAKALRELKKAPPAVAPAGPPSGASISQPSAPNGADSGVSQPPNPDDYTDLTKYISDRAKWEAKAAYDEIRREERQKAEIDAFNTSVRSRIDSAKTKYPDFEAVVLNPQARSPIVQDSLIEKWTFQHKHGMDVVYHLFKNPAEAQRIHALSPIDQLDELTLLGQRLTVPPQSATAASTRSAAAQIATPAPPPPNLVRSGAMRPGDEPPGDTASLAAHEQYFHKRRTR